MNNFSKQIKEKFILLQERLIMRTIVAQHYNY